MATWKEIGKCISNMTDAQRDREAYCVPPDGYGPGIFPVNIDIAKEDIHSLDWDTAGNGPEETDEVLVPEGAPFFS